MNLFEPFKEKKNCVFVLFFFTDGRPFPRGVNCASLIRKNKSGPLRNTISAGVLPERLLLSALNTREKINLSDLMFGGTLHTGV